MIKLNFQSFGKRGFQLRLRLYDGSSIKYINVTKYLKGNLYKKHWNAKRKCFYPAAPYSSENNEFLNDFIKKYEQRAEVWDGTLDGFIASFGSRAVSDKTPETKTLSWMYRYMIDTMKSENVNADGTLSGGYEGHEKAERRIMEFCEYAHVDYSKLALDDIGSEFVNNCRQWIAKRKTGRCVYILVSLRAVLNKAYKMGWYNFSKVEHCEWPKKNSKSTKKNESLSDDLCRKFIALSDDELPNHRHKILFRDFCVFILYTCQSVCDAVALQYKNIQNIGGVDHFVFKRRKIAAKQSVDCTVPINDEMRKIMDRWKPYSKDDYIFPIRSKERIERGKTNNGDIKHFISRINVWLKKVGDLIDCPFPLHTYVFRHTGITHYISKGVPIIYVANLAGTSVKNCETIYYNNHGDTSSRDKVLSCIGF